MEVTHKSIFPTCVFTQRKYYRIELGKTLSAFSKKRVKHSLMNSDV